MSFLVIWVAGKTPLKVNTCLIAFAKKVRLFYLTMKDARVVSNAARTNTETTGISARTVTLVVLLAKTSGDGAPPANTITKRSVTAARDPLVMIVASVCT